MPPSPSAAASSAHAAAPTSARPASAALELATALDRSIWGPAEDASLADLARTLCELYNAASKLRAGGSGKRSAAGGSPGDSSNSAPTRYTSLTLPLDHVMIASPSHALLFPVLASMPPMQLRLRFALLRIFNRELSRTLPAFSMDGGGAHAASAWTVGARLRSLCHAVFSDVKTGVLDAALTATRHRSDSGSAAGSFTLRLSNYRALESEARGETSPETSGCMFAQAYESLSRLPSSALRAVRDASQDKAFEVAFEGESGIDAGGVYREGLQRMVDDVFSERFSLLVRCPNAVKGYRVNTNAYLPNPEHTGARALSMLEFLGKLIGLSLRTKACLPFAFPSIVWKAVAGGDAPSMADLFAMDAMFARHLTAIIDAAEPIDSASGAAKEPITRESEFAHTFPGLRWVALNTLGEEMELTPGGAHAPVRLVDRAAFVEAALHFRLHEFDLQLAAIRRGMGTLVPLSACSLFSGAQIEVLVCGRPDIDVAALRRHTRYEGGYSAAHPVMKRFWRILSAMSGEERAGYVRFAWGRSRLPVEGQHWTSYHTITMMRGGDAVLPASHTCFFQVDIPEISTDEGMRVKLLTSINYSVGSILNG